MRRLASAAAALSVALGASAHPGLPAYSEIVSAHTPARRVATPPDALPPGGSAAALVLRAGPAQPVDAWGRPSRTGARDEDDGVSVRAEGKFHCVGFDASSTPSARELTVPKLARVSTLRADRLLRRDKHTALQTRTIWVDPNTSGLKVVQQVETPLTLLASGPKGLRIYGYRTAQGIELVASLSHGALRHPRGMAHCGLAQSTLRVPRVGGDAVELVAEIPEGTTGFSGHVVTAHVSVSRLASEPAPRLSVAFRVDRSPARDNENELPPEL